VSDVHVYKIGGPALEDPGLVGPLAEEVKRVDGKAVLVHGGGRHVDRLLRALGIESRFVDGRRERASSRASSTGGGRPLRQPWRWWRWSSPVW